MMARRGTLLGFTLIVVAVLLGGFEVPDAAAAVTSLWLDSDPGDYIGGGAVTFFAQEDGSFTARRNYANGVSVAFNTPNYSHWWYLDFGAPDGQFLATGLYSGAARFAFREPGQPGLDIYGDGRGCNTLTGGFEVKEVTYGSGDEIVTFRATFEQHCEGAAAALRGEIRFNATVAIELVAPATATTSEGQLLSFDVTATEIDGRHVTLAAAGLPDSAGFIDHEDNTGTFSWTPFPGQAGAYAVAFTGDNEQGTVETRFTRIAVALPPPPNDEIDRATVVSGIPFTYAQNTSGATAALDDPSCFGQTGTVWFTFTPASDMWVEVNTFGSEYDTTLSVYAGVRGALSQAACNDNSQGLQSRVRFNAGAGITYYLMVSSPYGSPAGNLALNLIPGPPPLAVFLTVSEFGSLGLTTGAATVGGTLICNRPVFASIMGQLTETHGKAVLTGFFYASVFCDSTGTASWTATTQSSPALFHGRAVALFVGGPVNVSVSAFAFDFEAGDFAQSTAAAKLVLRGRH
jgi:hypothetical protein